MPKIVNTNPNASHNVNGIAFERKNGFMVSVEPIDGPELALLSRVPGFVVLEDPPSVPAAASAPAVVLGAVQQVVYADGTKAAGPGDLPSQSPQEQAAQEAADNAQEGTQEPATPPAPPQVQAKAETPPAPAKPAAKAKGAKAGKSK